MTEYILKFSQLLYLELSPEERAQNVTKVLRRQADDVRTEWDKLNLRSADWQKKIDDALERLQGLQEAMDELDLKLRQAEAFKGSWQPVGDLLIDSLQDHLEKVKVCVVKSAFLNMRWLARSAEINLYNEKWIGLYHGDLFIYLF